MITVDIEVNEHISEFTVLKNPLRKKCLIFVNKNTNKLRKRFTIAPEIVHIVLGHLKKNSILVDNGSMENFFNEEIVNQLSHFEIEVNLFAGEILLLTSTLNYLIKEAELTSLSKLTKMFRVSKQAISIRSELLGLTKYLNP